MKTIYEPTGRAGEYALLCVNLYSQCSHGCKYCYCPNILKNPKFKDADMPRQGIIEALKKEAPKYANTNKRIHLSFIGDPYCPAEKEYKLTKQTLEIFCRNNIPFQVLTKGQSDLIKRDFGLYGKNDAFSVTLTCTDEQNSLHYEPKASLPKDRIKSLSEAKKRGIFTWVSIEPVINPDWSLKLIQDSAEYTDHFKVGILNINGRPAPDIDWRKFGLNAVELLNKLGKTFWIKHDLAKFLTGESWKQTDIRAVQNTVKNSLFES